MQAPTQNKISVSKISEKADIYNALSGQNFEISVINYCLNQVLRI